MLTLLMLVIVALLISAGGGFASLDLDMSLFPGGIGGVLVLIVIALLITRRI